MFIEILLFICFSYCGLVIFKWLLNYFRLCSIVNRIPGPVMVPLIGNALSFSPDGFIDQIEAMSNKFRSFPIFRLWIGTHFWIVFHKPEQLETVLNNSNFSDKPFEYDFLIPWIGRGLILSHGEKWQNRRRLISPTFGMELLNEFLGCFNEQTRIFMNVLREKATNGDEFDIAPLISNCTLDILCETVMGINVDAQRTSDSSTTSKYVDSVLRMGPVLFTRPVNPLYWSDFIFYRTKVGQEYQRHLKNLHEFTANVIRQKDAQYEAASFQPEKKKIAFLDLLLKAKHEQNIIDFDGIKEEVDTFMFAGHDTSANTLAWAIYLIGSNPTVQEKLFSEIENVLGNSDRYLTSVELNQLKYMDCVINETLRLYPPAAFQGRSIKEDCEIGGYQVPKGGTAIILTYQIHRDERYFEKPHQFIPERFSAEQRDKLHSYSFLPFSAGTRVCIGKKFAQYSMKVMLAQLVRNFRIESIEKPGKLKAVMDVILRPQKGVHVRLTERLN